MTIRIKKTFEAETSTNFNSIEDKYRHSHDNCLDLYCENNCMNFKIIYSLQKKFLFVISCAAVNGRCSFLFSGLHVVKTIIYLCVSLLSVLVYVCVVFLACSFVISAIYFLALPYKQAVWLAIQPSSTHHYLPGIWQWLSNSSIICILAFDFVALQCFCFSVGFLLMLMCFPRF